MTAVPQSEIHYLNKKVEELPLKEIEQFADYFEKGIEKTYNGFVDFRKIMVAAFACYQLGKITLAQLTSLHILDGALSDIIRRYSSPT